MRPGGHDGSDEPRHVATRLGIDVGGTFNDYVLERGGVLQIWKELGAEPRAAQVADGVSVHLRAGGVGTEFVHGSTLALNALLERRHRSPAIVTTAGFEDLFDLRRQQRLDLYRPWVRPVAALVPRRLRIGAHERVSATGLVLEVLTNEEIDRVVAALPDGIDAVAVCLLHAYANPVHEERLGEAIADARPELQCFLSSVSVPEIREYERLSTVSVDAYLAPVVRRYFQVLAESMKVASPDARGWVMQSGGGRADFATVAQHPTRTLMSGPAAGVLAAHRLAASAGFDNLITLDVGGTSADVALIKSSQAIMIYNREIGDVPILGPSIDIHSVGVGGGAIVSIDEGGFLTVGPESAGAWPGPACYGKGGERPTLSDAHVILGWLPNGRPLASGLTLSRDLAMSAFVDLSARLDRSIEEVAEAAVEIALSNMVNAVRLVSVERGYDPKDYVLVPFGGGGPLHACNVAERLGCAQIFVPAIPGVLSAFGLLASPTRLDASRSVMADGADVAGVQRAVRELAAPLVAQLNAADPYVGTTVSVVIDMRYQGQSWQIPVAMDSATFTGADLRAAFEREYRTHYGLTLERPVQYVTARVAVEVSGASMPPLESFTNDPEQRTDVRLRIDQEWLRAVEWVGGIPSPGAAGPALVCLPDTTVLLRPGSKMFRTTGGYVIEP